jgi:hypothetical protein
MATTRSDEKKIDSYRQGVEIGDYEQVFGSTLPRLLSNSSPLRVVNGRVREFGAFDDSLSQVIGKNNLSGSWSGSSTVISHFAEVRDLGIPRSTAPNEGFIELSSFNAAAYIQDTGERMYPITLENTSWTDPGRLDGAIEPLPVRQSISENIVVGFNNGRGVHAELGMTLVDRYHRNHQVDQIVYFSDKVESAEPFLEASDETNNLSDVPFFNPPVDDPKGFLDSSDIDETMKKLTDSGIVAALSKGSGYTFPGLSRNYKSSAAGRSIIGGDTNGTDSIAFADRRNY